MKKTISKLLNIISTCVLILIIIAMIPLTLPKAFGYKLYGVLTESMTPSYPVGSVVYVKSCEAEEISVGDVITYRTGRFDEVITHRVSEIREDSFITKGDANNTEDPEPILKTQLVGKVVFYIPMLAELSYFVTSLRGICAVVFVFALCILMWVISDRLKGERAGSKPKKSDGAEGKESEETCRQTSGGESKKRSGSIFILLGLVLIAAAIIYVGSALFTYIKSDSIYDAAQEEIIEDVEDFTTEDEELPVEEELSVRDKAIITRLNNMKEDYPDLVGYVLIPGTKISYPIMQGDDDSYYLSHAYTGEYNNAGSIFLTAYSASDFSEIHQILYGHNMRNGSMFGGLHKYEQDENYLSEHPTIYVYTLDTVIKYDIFSYYTVSSEDAIYNIFYENMEDFEPVFESMLSNSDVDTGIVPQYNQGILTLSTCNGISGQRFVVNAARRW